MRYSFKYLIKDGLITGFINAILLDNRLKRVCRDLDSLSVDKHFFKFLQLPGIISSSDETLSNESGECAGALMIEAPSESGDTKRAVKRKAPDDPDDPISSEKSFVALTPARAKNSHHRRIIKNITSCGPSTCSFLRYRTTHLSTDYREKNLKLKIDKGNAGGIDEEKLILPCQSETIIDDLITSDPSVMISCFGNAKKKFKAQIRKICAIVNRILGRIDKKRVKKCILYCKILERSILVRLKQRRRDGSRSCLFCDRVATRESSKVSAETVVPGQGVENNKIEEKSQNLLSDSGSSEEKFYSGEDSLQSDVPEAQEIFERPSDDDSRHAESSDSRFGITRCSSFYSCDSLQLSQASETEWYSARGDIAISDISIRNSRQFLQSFNPKSAPNMLEGKLNAQKSNLVEKNTPNDETIDCPVQIASDIQSKISDTLKSIFVNEHSDRNLETAKSRSIQTFGEFHKNYSDLEPKVLKMLESLITEAEAAVSQQKNSQNSSRKLQKIAELSDSMRNSICKDEWSQTPGESPRRCSCGEKKTRSIFTQTSPRREVPENFEIVGPKSPGKFPRPRKILSSPQEPSGKSGDRSSREESEKRLAKGTDDPALICILQETAERTLRCLTSASEIPPSPSRSGTFVISGEKLSEVEDFLTDLHLLESLSTPMNSKHCRCPSATQKPQSSDENLPKLHFLPDINKNLRIILRTMYRRFKVIFSQRAFDNLRHLIKQKIHRFILDREKSTNTSHPRMHFPREFSTPKKLFHSKKSDNWKIEGNRKDKIFWRKRSDFSDDFSGFRSGRGGNGGVNNFFRQRGEVEGRFLKNLRRCGSGCTCCSGWIDGVEHFGGINSRQSVEISTGEMHLHGGGVDSSIFQYPSGIWWRGGRGGHSYLDYRGRINREFRGMLLEHVNLCRNVRNSFIRRT
uniref:Uncharacterized protein n=1 Tax=Fopius arisanus TaxID=64838 RepID=A0A0C9Q224_9HYME